MGGCRADPVELRRDDGLRCARHALHPVSAVLFENWSGILYRLCLQQQYRNVHDCRGFRAVSSVFRLGTVGPANYPGGRILHSDAVARIFYPGGRRISDRTPDDSSGNPSAAGFPARDRNRHAGRCIGICDCSVCQKNRHHDSRMGNSASLPPSVRFSAHHCGGGLDAGEPRFVCAAGPGQRDVLSGIS